MVYLILGNKTLNLGEKGKMEIQNCGEFQKQRNEQRKQKQMAKIPITQPQKEVYYTGM